IARRVVGHHRRARDRATRREAGWSYAASDAPEATLVRADAVALIERFLDELDHDKREVFVLMEIEELSAREVATIVGAGAATVYSRLREGRRRFAAFVERERAARWSAP
ncbi:MAG TPA: sigma factor-like helix-turn-helix DNA-binding protein, partial [Nannocystaceae bacterium]|nr:sigma factor-like helix-turn-helix DNA-binding protein [Nannocystaceae bacterium]